MILFQILEHTRDHLIATIEEMTKGNCLVTATPVTVAQLGRRYVQVYNAGSGFIDDGGGALFRQLRVGVRLYNELTVDQISKFEGQAKDVQEFARLLMSRLHMHYDTLLQEPLRIASETALRRPDPTKPIWTIDQEYYALFGSHFETVKDF
jgi:hypothetical protein